MEQAQEETYLRQLARSQGMLTYSVFVDAYESAARRVGLRGASITRKQYGRWLAGNVRTQPQPDACRVLTELFQVPLSELFQRVPVSRPELGAIGTSPVSGTVWTATETFPRTGFRSTPTRLHELMMSAADDSRASAADAEMAIGPATMEALEADVYDLARRYLSLSPVAAFPMIVALRAQVEEKAQQTRQTRQLRDLSFQNALLCLLLAEACIDLGSHQQAADHARAAWTHANNIGHVELMTWARGMQATSAYWGDSPRRALVAVRRGKEHNPTGVAAARLSSIEARTYSHLGDIQQTMSAVRAAREARASASGQDDLDAVGGVFQWDLAREERCASTALVELISRRRNDLERAVLAQLTLEILAHCEHALATAQAVAPEKRSAIVEATILLDMGMAHLMGGDVSAAHETLASVFELPDDMRTFPVVHRAGSIRGELVHAQQTRGVYQLTEAVRSFAAASTVRALPAGDS